MDIETLFVKAGGATRLASKIGVARTTVLDWKRSGWIPGSRVEQISKALRIPIEEVLKLVQPGKTRILDDRTPSAVPSSPKPAEKKAKRSAATSAKPAPPPKREPKQSAELQQRQDEAA